jgi:manganese efflux pump family protein
VVALLIVAVALGLSNLAAAIGIGISGVGGALRVRVAIVFGVFEAGMPLVGLLLGRGVADRIGAGAHWLGGALLILVGGYGAVQAWRTRRYEETAREWRLGRIVLSGFALSVDNLAAGFALGAYHVSLGLAAALIGAVSVGMSLAGLELGARLGSAAGIRSELVAEVVLVAVGAAIAAGAM